MITKVLTATTFGLDAKLIEVEVNFAPAQLPGMLIVGMAEKSTQEARERVVSAVKITGYHLPNKKMVVNMAPAELLKTGAHYDLAIAISLLASMDCVEVKPDQLFIGELALDGSLRSINGVIAMADMCRKLNIKEVFLPIQNASEAALIPDIKVYGVASLSDLINHLSDTVKITQHEITLEEYLKDEIQIYDTDFSHIKGQAVAKRACEIAAAGGHNIILSGTPGSGKTMIARAFPSILPSMTFEESLEVTRIYSIAGQLPIHTPLITRRPFRSPHHTSSTVAVIGGGKIPRPGEVSLAHRGLLFLDEFPEFSVSTLEALRQPLEDTKVTVSRIGATITYPANFMLVAAMNPCRCGWKGDPIRKCICTQTQIQNYQKKVSGPILDRIDLQVNVSRVEINDLVKSRVEETSESIRTRVQNAREMQTQRFKDTEVVTNADIRQKDVEEFCVMQDAAKNLLNLAAGKMNLSARSYFRIIKVSRTIADLESSDLILQKHVAEALQYRLMNGEF